MNKTNSLMALFLLLYASTSFASQIHMITLSELHEKADLIVMAKVIKLVEDGNQDHVTIKTELYLKGKGPQTDYTFTLVTRGGLKDFDPSLKKGDTGVFFLKLKEQKGQVEKAYWGSVANFQKNHFNLTEEKTQVNTSIITSVKHPDHTDKQRGFENDLFTSLEVWRSHRVKHAQTQNIEEYERGFRKGFTGPPGLVDGSADFNLGHSDGMLAKMKIFPNHQNADNGK